VHVLVSSSAHCHCGGTSRQGWLDGKRYRAVDAILTGHTTIVSVTSQVGRFS
jgi:hypothetical protein